MCGVGKSGSSSLCCKKNRAIDIWNYVTWVELWVYMTVKGY